MVDVRVTEYHGIYSDRIEWKRPGVTQLVVPATLKHAVFKQHPMPGHINQVTGTGDLASRAMKLYMHYIFPLSPKAAVLARADT
jgi:hypothetical protein